jgi:DNA/RNA-binding domain of Phe-tRNA-synthetase-like protein
MDKLIFEASHTWKTTYPGAVVGILAVNQVNNPEFCPALEQRKTALEEELRARFANQDRAAITALPFAQVYAAYLKPFKKNYHVMFQLESVAIKGKSIPRVAALVEAMFMAELQSLLLTAGHDLDTLQPPVRLDIATGKETYQLLNGQEQVLKPGDMFIADAQGVISSIVYGPDQRTQITADTHRALFTVYAPAGIGVEAVTRHLEDILSYANLISPNTQVEMLEAYTTIEAE